jgi:ferrous iron transport protein B
MHIGYTIEPDDLYDDFTHEIHHRIGSLIHDKAYEAKIPAHWASIKLIEGDDIVKKALRLDAETAEQVEKIAAEYESSSDLGDRETLVADSRYQYIENVIRQAVSKGALRGNVSLSDKIDKVVTHKYLAVPIFLLMMLVMFGLTFGPIGSGLSDLFLHF